MAAYSDWNQFYSDLGKSTVIPTLAETKAANLAKKREEKLALTNPNKLADEAAERALADLYGSGEASAELSSGPIDALQAGFMTTMGKGAELVGEGIESVGQLVDSPSIEGYGTQIQKEQQQWRNKGKWNKLVGYDPKPVRAMGEQFADRWEKGDYFSAVGGLAQPAAISAFANSLPEMLVMSNPWGLGSVMASNVNKNLNDLGPNATDDQRAISVGLSVVGTALDRLGDKVVLGGGEKALTSMIQSMSKPAQEAVFKVYGQSLVRLGIGAGAFIGKAGFEGVTEGAQTLLEKKAANAELMNFAITEKERREALEAVGIGMGAGGVVAAPKAAKEIAATAGMSTVRGVAGLAEKGIDFAGRKATEANYKLISQDQRDEIQAKYDADDAKFKIAEAERNRASEQIKAAKSIDELKSFNDPEIDAAIDSVLDSDNSIKERRAKIEEVDSMSDFNSVDTWTAGKVNLLNKSNPSDVAYSVEEVKALLQDEITNSYSPADLDANIDKIKNEAISQYNKQNTTDKALLEGTRAKDYVYQASKNLYKGTKEAVEKAIPKELRDEIIKQAKAGVDLAKVGIDVATAEIKNLDKSTARAMMDDLTKGKVHKGLDAFSRKQLSELKTAFKDNERATKVLNKLIERKNKISSEFDKVSKKDVSFFDAVVDMGGKIKNSNMAAQIRGLGVITEEFLTDPANLSRAKALVKDLETKKRKTPDKFTKIEQSRLNEAKRSVLKAIRAEEQGAINNALRKVAKVWKEKDVNNESVRLAKKAYSQIEELAKKTYSKIEDSDLLKNLDERLTKLAEDLDKAGVDAETIQSVKPEQKKTSSEKKVTTPKDDDIIVVKSSEVSEAELSEIIEEANSIEADKEVSTAQDKPIDAKLTKEEVVVRDLLDSLLCNKG